MPSGILGMDYHLLYVQVAHADAPIIGRGRWTLKNYIICDEEFRSFVVQTGASLLETMKALGENCSLAHNPQSIYEK